MIRLELRYEDGQTQHEHYPLPLMLGRDKGCDLVIRSWRVAKRHAQLIAKERGVFLEDLGALSGTLLNGKRIFSYGPLQIGDQIIIGPCLITIKAIAQGSDEQGRGSLQDHKQTSQLPPIGEALHTMASFGSSTQVSSQPHSSAAAAEQKQDMDTQQHKHDEHDSVPKHADEHERSRKVSVKPASGMRTQDMTGSIPHPAVAQDTGKNDNLVSRLSTNTPSNRQHKEFMALEIYHRQRLHSGLLDALDLRRINVAAMSDEVLHAEVAAILDRLVQSDTEIGTEFNRESLKQAVLHEAVGLGPLEILLKDPSISEIMVNRFDEIYIEKSGRLSRSEAIFSSEKAVLGVIDRIVAPLGRRIDEGSPMVDARLKDGSRVNAVIPPIALRGASITIRKFASQRPQLHDLIQLASLDKHMAQFLSMCVENRMNMIVSGGTGSGKTTLLNILSNCIPERERIVTIEDAAELRLNHEHLVSLEARPENLEGKGLVQIRDLVRNALRMRPDRIVVGECRGAEAFDMLSAMNTGHEGSLTTLHANSARDALARLETMILMAGMDLPLLAIREHIASSIDFIVQQTRLSNGRRVISSIVEVDGLESGVIKIQEIFRYDRTSTGAFVGAGIMPSRFERLRQEGQNIDSEMFTQYSRLEHSGSQLN
ncbi:MAG: ATPase, T2SS/T4P/T4SS family [Pelistega sp.]|nr:ATPase, T2SS/T4P/T4SS family [Pelistega sp.]